MSASTCTKRGFAVVAATALPAVASACATCRPDVLAAVFDGDMLAHAAMLLVPIAALVGGVFVATGARRGADDAA